MVLGREQHEEPGPAAPAGPVSKLIDKAASVKDEVVDKVESSAARGGEVVDEVESSARAGAAQAGRSLADLGRTLSPKRLLKRAAVAAALALVRRHLGIVGAAAGTLVLVGAAGYYAGRRSRPA